MRKPFITLLTAILLSTLSACQLLEMPGPGDQKSQGIDEYDYAVVEFEAILDEVQRIQEALYGERWLFTKYGNRPVGCDKGSGAQFNILRMTPESNRLEGSVPRTVQEAHERLQEAGFTVGQIQQASDGHDKTFRTTGNEGNWRIMLNDHGAWSIHGASRCIDVNDKTVWNEMTTAGFAYVDYTEWALFPHERLSIRRGETPAPSPTPYPASPTYGRPRPTSTQYFPPATPPATSPTASRPATTPAE